MLSLLSENMSSILTGFFTLGSSALTLYITNRFSEKKQKKELYREKLEKAFSLLGIVSSYVVKLPIKIAELKQEKEEAEKKREQLPEDGELYMIISCYAPTILPTYELFMVSWLETYRLIIERNIDADEYSIQMQAFTKTLHDFQKAIQSEIKKYN
jgi:hypothetical protein